MSKQTRLILFFLILLLTGCNRPQGSVKGVPLDTMEPVGVTNTAEPQPDPTQNTQATSTQSSASTQETDPTQESAPPTEGAQINLEGIPIPLLAGGAEINIHKIQMINKTSGWALSQDSEGIDHILRTTDGGLSWRDITPPQPNASNSNRFPAEVYFSSPDHGWATYAGTNLIWSTINGGKTWTVQALEFESLLGNLLFSLDPNQVWLFQFLEGGMQKVYTALFQSKNGQGWTKLLDPYTDSSIQGFDKTGVVFVNSEYGWLTRDFRGVTISVYLDVTPDGGATWQNLEIPPPPTDADAFTTCACGLYDPSLVNTAIGSARLSCACYLDDLRIDKNYLYRTLDGGSSWFIKSMPAGELHFINGQTYYSVGREIYRTSDSGENWNLIKSVNWDGQFSFIDLNFALAVAYDPDDDEFALVKTSDGCSSFDLINPVLLPSQSSR